MFRFLSLTAVILLSFSCVKKQDEVAQKPVISVDGEVLTAEAFSISLAKKLKVFDALGAKDATNLKRAKDNIIREFIVSALLKKFAKAHKVEISDAELEEEILKIRKSYPDDLTFKASLASQNLDFSDWRNQLRSSLLEKKVFSVLHPTEGANLDAEIRKYYEANKSQFQRPEQIHLQQLVVAKEDDAERLLKRLKAGANFSDLAKRFGISPDAADGGDIGFIGKGVTPAFDQAFKLRSGQLSPVTKSNYGFHIMKVLDRRKPSVGSLENARPRIEKILLEKRQQEAFRKWLEDAVKSSKILQDDLLIERIIVKTKGRKE